MFSLVRLLSFAVLAASLFIQSNVSAATQTVFGPKNYSPGLLKPTDVTEQFASNAAPGFIKVVNGDGRDVTIPVCTGNAVKKLLCEASNLITKAQLLLTRPSTFSIELNNQVVASQSNLPLTKGSIELPINIKASNKIRIRVAGSFLSKIKIEISVPSGTVNQLPIASMQLSHGQGFAPLTVTANGIASIDPDGDIVDFSWDFGDGGTSSGAVASHIFTTPGAYSVRLTVRDNNGATNSQTKQVLVLQNQIPSADLRLASSGTGLAPLMVMFDGSRSKDPENGSLRYFWNFGDGSEQVEGRPNETHEFVNPGSYTVVLIVRDENGGQAQSSVSVQVNAPVLPPAPETIAPPIADIAYPTFEDKISFLYTGENPIQTGVNEAAINPKLLSVIRGKVFDGEGQPLAGVTVKLLNEKDFGQTLSRADGSFDLAFNSGEFVTLEYSKNGYLLSQRRIDVKGQDYYNAQDVRLTKLETKVTSITLGSAESQVAQGSLQVDSSGERTGTVIFPPQTQATIVMEDGSTKTVPELKIRLTEYTVGENGPQKMPGTLPANTAYTYAIEVSADEALALGGRSIKFNKPVSFYVDNFLNFPVGVAVPVGSYDNTKGVWTPGQDGLIIKVIGRTTDGIAQVDIGANRPANQLELSQLGFDSDELKKLALTYEDGKTLWRVTTNHFSSIDLNFVKYPEYQIENRADLETAETDEKSKELCATGCVIRVDSAVMQEYLDLAGVDFKLSYSTDRMPGRKTGGRVSGAITGGVIFSGLKRIDVRVSVAGKTYEYTYSPQTNLQFDFQWDGFDAYGRAPVETVLAKVFVKYVFNENYKLAPFNNGSTSFGGVGTVTGNPVAGRATASFDKQFSIPLKATQRIDSPAAKKVANGWFITSHHAYDVRQNAIFFGDGKNLLFSSLPQVYKNIAGTGVPGFSGDGGPARFAKLNSPTGAVAAADGSIYIADRGNNRIRKIDPSGIISTVAGNGMSGYSGDNGPAEDATLNAPFSIKVNRDGSFYIADTGNHCVRFVDEFGNISTFAGVCGQAGFTSGLKTEALLNSPKDIAFNGDGSIYLSDTGNHSIRRINPVGNLETIAGTGAEGAAVDAVDALVAQFREPRISDVDESGNLFIADKGNNFIRRLAPGGGVKFIAGPALPNSPQFFLPALNYKLQHPNAVAVTPAGEVYFTDELLNTISFLDLNGWVNPLIGYRIPNDPFDTRLATGTTAKIIDIQGIFLNKDGTKMFTDAGMHSVSTFGPVKPEFTNGNYVIPSQDGSEVFVFDGLGKHLRTLYGKTGAIKYTFDYDSENFLVGVTDSFSNRTVLNRTGNFVSQIVGPYGHSTSFGVDSNGYLNRMTNPTGDVTEITYTDSGLITAFKKPKGNTSRYSYNQYGELQQETNPLGGWQIIFKNDIFTTSYSTSMGKFIFSEVQTDEDGYEKTSTIGTNRKKYETIYSGSTSNVDTDGTYDESTTQYDYRSGGITSFVGYHRVMSNGGFTSIQKVTRSYEFPTANYFDFVLTEKLFQDGDVVTVKKYDSQSKAEIVTSATGKKVSIVNDQWERPTSIQVGDLEPISSTFDSRGKLVLKKQGDRQTAYEYDNRGRLGKLIDAFGRQFSFGYDESDRLITKVLPGGEAVHYSYDSNSKIVGIKPPDREWHLFGFNLGDLFSIYQPNGASSLNSTSYVYNADLEVQRKIRPDGLAVNYFYDRSTRDLVTVQTDDRTQSSIFTYNSGSGKITRTSSSDNIVQSLEQDAFLQTKLTYSGQYSATVENIYRGGNPGGEFQIYSQKINGSEVIREYDLDRSLVKVGPVQISRNANSLIESSTLGRITEQFSYNSYGELIGKRVLNSGAEIYSESYERDKLSRIVNKVTAMAGVQKVFDYSYDIRGQLVQVDVNRLLTRSYSYDTQGNRLNLSAQYDGEDRLVRKADFDFTYTANGELLTRTNTVTSEVTTYTYDIFGSLKNVVLPDGKVISYFTDANARRSVRMINGVKQSILLYDANGSLVAELGGDGSLKSQFYFLSQNHSPDGMKKDGIDYKFIKDQLGSIRLVVNSNTGEIAQSIEYDEFGVVLVDTNPGFQPFGFVGGIYDTDTKLIRFGVRDYDPSIGRWTAKDPILFVGGDANLYAYVGNDPVNLSDPSGNCPWCIGAVLGGVASGVTAYLAGGDAKTIAISAAVGAAAGAASMGASAFATSAAATVGVNAAIGAGANIVTQLATGTSVSNLNYSAVGIGAVAGGVGAAVGLGAGTAAFFGTPVIGQSIGVTLARANERWISTLVGTSVGTVLEGAGSCK